MRDDNFYDWDNFEDPEKAREMLERWKEVDRQEQRVQRALKLELSILELSIYNAVEALIEERTPLAQAAEIETLQLLARISRK